MTARNTEQASASPSLSLSLSNAATTAARRSIAGYSTSGSKGRFTKSGEGGRGRAGGEAAVQPCAGRPRLGYGGGGSLFFLLLSGGAVAVLSSHLLFSLTSTADASPCPHTPAPHPLGLFFFQPTHLGFLASYPSSLSTSIDNENERARGWPAKKQGACVS
jgi:hypothetical protein